MYRYVRNQIERSKLERYVREQILTALEGFPLQGSPELTGQVTEMRTQVALRLVQGLMMYDSQIVLWYPEVLSSLQFLNIDAQYWIDQELLDLEPTVLVQIIVFSTTQAELEHRLRLREKALEHIKDQLFAAIDGRSLQAVYSSNVWAATELRCRIVISLATGIMAVDEDGRWLSYFKDKLATSSTDAEWWMSLYVETMELDSQELVSRLFFTWGGTLPQAETKA